MNQSAGNKRSVPAGQSEHVFSKAMCGTLADVTAGQVEALSMATQLWQLAGPGEAAPRSRTWALRNLAQEFEQVAAAFAVLEEANRLENRLKSVKGSK